MKKNRITQFFLLVLALIFIFFTYYTKEHKDELTIDTKNLNEITSNLTDKKTNIIENIEYIGTDNRGNSFLISSDLAEIYSNKPDLSYMENVKALIKLSDGRKIKISSDRAIYNRINNDTKFIDNVLMTESDNIIMSNNLDLYTSKNLITIFNDIKYKSNKGLLIADKIDINLLNQETNIYMYNNKKKVQAQFIN